MESLLDDIWLKVFAYIDSKELMNSRFVCRHWDSLVLQHLHQELTCYIDFSKLNVHRYTRQGCILLQTTEEANLPYYVMMNKLSQMNEFLQKYAIKRVCIKWWFDMTTPKGVYGCKKPNLTEMEENKRKSIRFLPPIEGSSTTNFDDKEEEEENRRAIVNRFLQSYFEAWHPLMSELATLLCNCTYLCMRRCELNWFLWKWLFGHCALTELYIDHCYFEHCEGKFDEIKWPATVCILPTPRATLTKLRVRNLQLEPTFLQTVNSCVDSLANVRQFECTFEKPKLGKRNLDQLYQTIDEFYDSSLGKNVKLKTDHATLKKLIDFTHSSLPSLDQFTLTSGQPEPISW